MWISAIITRNCGASERTVVVIPHASVIENGPPPALAIEGLSKSFAGTLALANVDLTIASGEVRGLVGPNGSGKSTLVKVMSGYHQPDRVDRIAIGGRELAPGFSAHHIQAAGVGFVHQDLALVDQCSIADNLAFGPRGFVGRLRIDWRRHFTRVEEALARVNLKADPRCLVGALMPAERTLVAIARALSQFGHAHLLVLDEPTARLPHADVDLLLDRLRKIAVEGTAILYVTHRMNELFTLAERITVLKDGRNVATLDTAATSIAALTDMMIGAGGRAQKRSSSPSRSYTDEAPVASLRGVSTDRLRDVTLSVHAGEILALTGAIGSGAEDCGDLLYGLKRPLAGCVTLHNRVTPPLSIASARAARVAFLPPERTRAGFMESTTGENILIADFVPVTRGIHIDRAAANRDALAVARKTAVSPPDPEHIFRGLSGGNQQKALLGKWLRVDPSLMILNEPTHGVDVVSRLVLHREVEKARDRGVAVLWITSDLEEAVAVADRIGVFFKGSLRLMVERSEADAAQISRAALGS
jgi:ribose transport system ATP-binding protein